MAQIGTIKVQTDSGIVDVPVFDVGDSGGSVSEALRVQTDSGIGFVPLTDPADAASLQEAIRVQTDSGIKAVHDSASVITLVDNFEDNSATKTTGSNWSTWAVNSGSWGTVDSPNLSDDFSGKFVKGTNGGQPFEVITTRDTADSIGIEFLWRADYQSGIGKDEYGFSLNNSGTIIAMFSMEMDGDVVLGFDNNSQSGFASWSTGEIYQVKVEMDYANEEFTVTFDGQSDTTSFFNSANSIDEFSFGVDNFNGGQDAEMYIDDILEI